MTLKSLFFGSPDVVIPVLESMLNDDNQEVLAVFTQPDRPVGRKQALSATPVKQYAEKHGLPVWTPEKLNMQGQQMLQEQFIKRPDVIVLAAYGLIIPKWLLDWPKYGVVNLHPSLLPAYRGASPAFGTILRGDEICGLTYMQMDAELDHGPVIAQVSYPTPEDVDYLQLTAELFEKGAHYLPNVLAVLTNTVADTVLPSDDIRLQIFNPPQVQDHRKATIIWRFSKQDGFISWELLEKTIAGEAAELALFNPNFEPLLHDVHDSKNAAETVERLIRALSPWPKAWTVVPVEKLLIEVRGTYPEGVRMQILTAAFRKNRLELMKIKIAGKVEQDWSEVRKALLEK